MLRTRAAFSTSFHCGGRAELAMLNRTPIRAAFGTSSFGSCTRFGYISVTAALSPVTFGSPPRHDHVHLRPNQLGCQSRKSRVGAVGRSVLDGETLTLDVSEVPQPLAECRDVSGVDRL